jgi:hypothetical protein
MHLIDIDVVCLQPVQGILDLTKDPRTARIANTTSLRRPPSAIAVPTISSERPKPYAGAVSMTVMP